VDAAGQCVEQLVAQPVAMSRKRYRQLGLTSDLTAQLGEPSQRSRFATAETDAQTAGGVYFSQPPEHPFGIEHRVILRRVAVAAPQIACVRQCDRKRARCIRPLLLGHCDLVEEHVQSGRAIERVHADAVAANLQPAGGGQGCHAYQRLSLNTEPLRRSL
jgi:hypothetical protein